MTCREFVADLEDFVSVEAEQERLDALDAHVATCVACAAFLQTYLDSIRLCLSVSRGRAPEREQAPESLIQRILERWLGAEPRVRAGQACRCPG